MQGFLRKSAQSAGEDFFNPADIADHRRKIYSGISAQIRAICGRRFFFIPLISQITAEKIAPGISAQIRADLREKRVFLRKSAPICRRVFII
jgi:hypothetical protein